MERELFTNQMKRLAETYGEKAYPKERMALLWNAFRHESDEAFTDAVSELIVTCRSMPMLKEFEGAVDSARARHRPSAGGTLAKILGDAAQKSAASPEVKEICMKAINYRLNNKVSPDEWAKILSQVDAVVKETKRQKGIDACRKCDDSGVVFLRKENGNDCVARCSCDMGTMQPAALNWKDGPRPFPKYTDCEGTLIL